jgi:hypothetical protein
MPLTMREFKDAIQAAEENPAAQQVDTTAGRLTVARSSKIDGTRHIILSGHVPGEGGHLVEAKVTLWPGATVPVRYVAIEVS